MAGLKQDSGRSLRRNLLALLKLVAGRLQEVGSLDSQELRSD